MLDQKLLAGESLSIILAQSNASIANSLSVAEYFTRQWEVMPRTIAS